MSFLIDPCCQNRQHARVLSRSSISFASVSIATTLLLFSNPASAKESKKDASSPLIEPIFEITGRRVLSQRPVPGRETSTFGYRNDPVDRFDIKHHNGIDYRGDYGTTVKAAAAGKVIKATRLKGYGRVVYLDHGNGVQTRYAHLKNIKTKVGERIIAGQKLGTVGSTGRATGPHLHFEARINGKPCNPDLLWTPGALNKLKNAERISHASRH